MEKSAVKLEKYEVMTGCRFAYIEKIMESGDIFEADPQSETIQVLTMHGHIKLISQETSEPEPEPEIKVAGTEAMPINESAFEDAEPVEEDAEKMV